MNIIELIEKYGVQFLIQWLHDLKNVIETLPQNFNWLTLVENVSSKVLGEEKFDLDFAKSAILIYEKIANDGNNGALLSTVIY